MNYFNYRNNRMMWEVPPGFREKLEKKKQRELRLEKLKKIIQK